MKEEAALFGKASSLVGILTDPPTNNGSSLGPAVILLNPGIVHRVAPGRIYVKIARALAGIGFVVFRFDFSGIGDSGVRRDHLPFEKSSVEETQDAMDWLSANRGIRHFILMGGCSGARIALETACSDPRVVGAVLMNFVLAETDNPDRMNRTAGYYYLNLALFDPRSWRKLLTGRTNYRNLIRVLKAHARGKFTLARKTSHESLQFQAQLRQLAGRNVPLTFVCSQGDPCVDALREAGGDELKRLCALDGMTLKVIPRSDHTLSSLFDHERLMQVILERVGGTTQERRKNDMKNCQKLPKRIAFFGHFGTGNFGNEITLQAILYHVRRLLPDAQLSCHTTGPEETTAIHNIEATSITETLLKSWQPRNPLARFVRRFSVGMISEIYRWAKVIRILRRTDMLIIPGTGLLTDAYGLLGWGPYNLFKWSLTAKLCRCKLLFVSVGAGPIYGVFARWLVKSALSLADFRSYRDSGSAQYLESIGFRTRNDRVYPDLAFNLPDVVVPDCDPTNSGKPVIGLGLMSYAGKYSVPNPRNETYQASLNNLARVVQWLVARQYDVNLTIGNYLDEPVKQEFRRLLKEQLSGVEEGHIIDESISCVEQLLLQIAATDMVVATRFHTVLLALLNNKPVIALSYHPKCASLMDAMGLSEYCLDINTLNSDTLIEKIRDLEKNAGELKPLIRRKTKEFREALDEQYKLIFNDVWSDTAATEDVRKHLNAQIPIAR